MRLKLCYLDKGVKGDTFEATSLAMRRLGLLREGSVRQGPSGKRHLDACAMLQAGTLRRCAKRLVTRTLGRRGGSATLTTIKIVCDWSVATMRRRAPHDSGRHRPTALHLVTSFRQAPSSNQWQRLADPSNCS